MKNIALILFVLSISHTIFSQVGINTTSPDGSAALDIESTSAGVLIPRMTEAQKNAITSPALGLLIFQTDGTSPGFYYYSGSVWAPISSAGSNWSITGNSGTNPTTNFIGTTDSQDFVLRTNNSEKIRLTASGQLEFLNPSNSIFIGTEAGEVDNQTNNTNIGVGYRALYNNTNGYDNIAIGRLSLTNNTTGRDNTAIGEEALINNLTGYDNIALGDKLLSALTSGNNNIAIGDRTLISTNGSYNLAIGSSAGSSNLGSNNIFLGYQAGYSETGSNKLYIENSSANSNNALIYGEFDNNILRTNGTLQINNPSSTGYAFPTADGTAGQVLTTDGAGLVTWQTPTTGILKSVMQADLISNQLIPASTITKIAFNQTITDRNGEFDTVNNRFVATNNGYYHITANVTIIGSGTYTIVISKNGAPPTNTIAQKSSNLSESQTISIDTIEELTATDYLELYIFGNNIFTISGSSDLTQFNVFQID